MSPSKCVVFAHGNLAKHAPGTTRMHIHASSEVEEVYLNLKEFQQLEFLRWGYSDSSTETEPTSPNPEVKSLLRPFLSQISRHSTWKDLKPYVHFVAPLLRYLTVHVQLSTPPPYLPSI